MKMNQNGFGAIGIVVIVAAVGLLGGGLWYVWQAQGNSDESKGAQESTERKSYSRYGITFHYPSNWRLVADDNAQSQATMLFSPDSTPMPSTNSDGYPYEAGVSGQRISITESSARDGITADTFKSNFLDSSANPNQYSDYKELTINGKKAIQLRWSNDASITTYFFLEGNREVAFVLDMFTDADTTTYEEIVESVIVN